MTLTEPGSALLAEGRAILNAVAAAERRTRQAATDDPKVVPGAKAGASGELPAKLRDAYAAEPGAVGVELVLCESQPQLLLRDGQADMALLHEPYDSTVGFDTEVLHSQDQIAVTTVIAWPPHSRSRAVADLIRVATRV
ncbi:hypothetical protein AB0F52_14630 [Amycolatopsis sp. NPDC024027]|uniref:hypothetical protein n=1 Tax=Amycolatopsis sp. NPDC024027 TaxID=3154327 RepID=UPI0033D84D51